MRTLLCGIWRRMCMIFKKMSKPRSYWCILLPKSQTIPKCVIINVFLELSQKSASNLSMQPHSSVLRCSSLILLMSSFYFFSQLSSVRKLSFFSAALKLWRLYQPFFWLTSLNLFNFRIPYYWTATLRKLNRWFFNSLFRWCAR